MRVKRGLSVYRPDGRVRIDVTARCSCEVWECLRKGFFGADSSFVWVEAAHDIQSAKKRVYELSRHSDAEFVIFNEHTLQVVATFETPIGF
jgi:hypothetical protein